MMTTKHIQITVQCLPEGVFLATSVDVPGLTVECETREAVVELIELELGHPLERRPKFAFTFI